MLLTGCILSTTKIVDNRGVVNVYTHEKIDPSLSAQASQSGDATGGVVAPGSEISTGIGPSEITLDATTGNATSVKYNGVAVE